MPHHDPAVAAHWRARWMRHDAHLWIRPDAQRWMHPDRAYWGLPPAETPQDTTSMRQTVEDEAAARILEAQAARELEQELLDLRASLARLRTEVSLMRCKAARRRELAEKAGFNADQPRDDGGKWTGTGASGRPQITVTPAGNEEGEGGGGLLGEESGGNGDTWLGDGWTDSGAGPLSITVTPASIGDNGGPPLEDPPVIPPKEPGTAKARNTILRAAARWAVRAAKVGGAPLGLFLASMETIGWLKQHRELFDSYQDPPKTLKELQDAVKKWERGYDVHHIVEQTPAKNEGFSTEPIDGSENLVRIPRYKHNEITSWYQTKNDDFGGLSPRAYLQGKDWQERTRVGLIALRKVGVLKP